jgi:predicted metal-dependent HD superfamily phosphohydrolase
MNLQELLNKWNIKCDINTLLAMWNESHRHYHNLNHLNDLISQINDDKSKYSEKEYEKLLITALFHDCVYDPMKTDNEDKSADFFMECCSDKSNPDILEIKQMILDTKNHHSKTMLSKKFNQYDMNIVERDFEELLEWERGIYAEYKSYGKETYRVGRLKFLESLLDKYVDNTDNLLKLIKYVKEIYK